MPFSGWKFRYRVEIVKENHILKLPSLYKSYIHVYFIYYLAQELTKMPLMLKKKKPFSRCIHFGETIIYAM